MEDTTVLLFAYVVFIMHVLFMPMWDQNKTKLKTLWLAKHYKTNYVLGMCKFLRMLDSADVNE